MNEWLEKRVAGLSCDDDVLFSIVLLCSFVVAVLVRNKTHASQTMYS